MADRSPESTPDVKAPHGIFGETWELELLISGAVVFALMQVPPVVEREAARLEPHLTSLARMVFMVGVLYVTVILYTLIFSFLLHLAARAYWVGMMGLHATFPGGVRWDVIRTRTGPIAERLYRERVPSLHEKIVKVDAFCSAIFGFAFMVVLLFAASVLLISTFGGVAYLISKLFLNGEWAGEIFLGLLLVLTIVPSLAAALDKGLEKRINPEGWLARGIEKILALNFRIQLVSLQGPISMTLYSNLRKRTMYILFAILTLGVIGLMVGKVFRGRAIPWSAYVYLPGEEEGYEPFAFYEDQRPAEEVFPRTPSIQSDVIRGPYVKLFIPYLPDRHDPAVTRQCPGLKPPGDEAAGREAALRALMACLARVQPVALDGKPLTGVDFHPYTHPKTGVRGILGYIPTAGLSRGSHELRIAAVANPVRKRFRKEPPEPYVFRFWL